MIVLMTAIWLNRLDCYQGTLRYTYISSALANSLLRHCFMLVLIKLIFEATMQKKGLRETDIGQCLKKKWLFWCRI